MTLKIYTQDRSGYRQEMWSVADNGLSFWEIGQFQINLKYEYKVRGHKIFLIQCRVPLLTL